MEDAQICDAPPDTLYALVARAPQRRYTDGAVARVLQRDAPQYARVFYVLSGANRTVAAASYTATFLHRNIANFSEDELLLVCEGVRLQLERGEDDFYYVTHHFFAGLDRSPQLRSFLLHLTQRGDYRLREFLLTHGVAERMLVRETATTEGRVFVARFVKALVAIDGGVIRARLAERGVRVSIARRDDCIGFFAAWLEAHGGSYRDMVEMR